ncbi:MAG: hypothetical protein H7A52_17805 [Akkermansiaceae bacterium]|nr:hypothetical protein [Akkermansiaceae bacterium]
MKRILRWSAAFVVFAVLGAVAWYGLRGRYGPPPPGTIAVRGGEVFDWPPPENATHFRQSDPRWGETAIGGSGEAIGAVGCTLCCVGMAFEQFGIDTDPEALNRSLIELDGYTEQGWIKWNAVERAAENRVRVTIHDRPSHETIDDNLKSGKLTLAKFFLPLGIPHWALICGKQGDDYLILDPALKDPRPILFSKRAGAIVSIRSIGRR